MRTPRVVTFGIQIMKPNIDIIIESGDGGEALVHKRMLAGAKPIHRVAVPLLGLVVEGPSLVSALDTIRQQRIEVLRELLQEAINEGPQSIDLDSVDDDDDDSKRSRRLTIEQFIDAIKEIQ